MIPRAAVELDSTLPDEHTGWTPKKSDLSEDGEGFGYFRDTWIIRDVGVREARRVNATEAALVELAGRLAENDVEFNLIASALEHGTAEGLSDRLGQPALLAELLPYLNDESPVEGLELGVAGLVHALAAVGCWPAASCRGHPTGHAWSDRPVVLLACDRHRARTLQMNVDASGCGLNTDPARLELLVVEAASIVDLMALAERVVGSRKDFIPRRPPRRHSHPDSQGSFDFDV